MELAYQKEENKKINNNIIRTTIIILFLLCIASIVYNIFIIRDIKQYNTTNTANIKVIVERINEHGIILNEIKKQQSEGAKNVDRTNTIR